MHDYLEYFSGYTIPVMNAVPPSDDCPIQAEMSIQPGRNRKVPGADIRPSRKVYADLKMLPSPCIRAICRG